MRSVSRMLSSPSTWFVGGKRARQAQSDGNTRIRTVLPGCTLLLIASFGAQSDRFALLWSDLPTSLYVPNSALPALCQHLAAAACFFDWRTVPARRSASKRCHLDDHGPQKEPPRSPFWPLRVLESPLCPRWSDLAIANTTPPAGSTEGGQHDHSWKQEARRTRDLCRASIAAGQSVSLHREVEQAAVIRDYEDWLAEQLLDPRSAASIEIHRLAALARKQDLCLVCWYAPKACHADIIKRTIEAMGSE